VEIHLGSALLVVATLLSPASPQSAFLHLPQSQKGYRDSPKPAPFQGVHMTMGVSGTRLKKMVEPEYPQRTEAEGIEGDVIFRIIIGTGGKVKEIHLRRGKLLLVEATARAVSDWEYEPYVLNGSKVEVETFAAVRFRLH
jgi:protein TonB